MKTEMTVREYLQVKHGFITFGEVLARQQRISPSLNWMKNSIRSVKK